MTKKITLTLLVGIFVFAFGVSATAQKATNSTKKENVTVAEKMKTPEKYNPKPQTVQTTASKNPIKKRTVEQEIKDLKIIVARLEAKEEKLPFEVKRLAKLKQELAQKEKAVKK